MYINQSLIVPTRTVLIGMALGAVAGLAIAQLQPGPTLAAVLTESPFNTGATLDPHLAKFDGAYFAIGTLPGVSLTPESSVTVRKIGYGRTSLVTVATTSSGTYSSDGLASPYVRYPGIVSAPLDILVTPRGGVLGWSKLSGWVQIPLQSADSIGFLDDDSVPASRDDVCVTAAGIGGCR